MKRILIKLLFFVIATSSVQLVKAQNWTWLKGSSGTGGFSSFGTVGTETANNTPGARRNAASFKDANGNMWIFGGQNGTDLLNDLWRFNVNTNNWTFMGGSTFPNRPGSVGGIVEPSARYGCGYTTDSNGDFYIYGGIGRSSTFPNNNVYLYDIFKYTVSTGVWTNISEGNLGNTPASGSSNTAGYFTPCLWATSTHLYAFAGSTSTGPNDFANQMYKYSFATNTWSLVNQGATQMGTYNGVGTAGYPSARYLQTYWKDNAGNFWMFGGFGRGTNMNVPNVNLSLNDLWRFNPTTETWTQINSDNNSNSGGNYGTINVAAAANRPPNMTGASVAAISNNTFLLFGGTWSSQSYYNTSWTFNTITNQWTWVGGGDNGSTTSAGFYGTQGTANSANIPGVTESHNAISSGNNYYIFGGYGRGSDNAYANKNTVMRFDATALISGNTISAPTISNISSSNVLSTSARINYTINANNNATASSIAYGISSTNLNVTVVGSSASGSLNTDLNTTLTNLLPNTTYFYRVSASNTVGNATPSNILQFTTSSPAPSLTVAAPTNVTFSSATLNYTVNANGSNSFVSIRYGTTSGNLTTQVSGSNTITGSSNTILSKDLFSLSANTTYYYKVFAINVFNDTTSSNVLSFTTSVAPIPLPVISNVGINTVTNNAANITYTINANGANTTPVVRYGTSSTNLSLSATGSIVSGSVNTNGVIQLTGLTLGTQYFYRVEASNSGGSATPSATSNFTTASIVLNAPVNGLVAYYGFNNNINSHNGNHNMTSAVAATYGTGIVGNGVTFTNNTNNTLFNNTLTNDLPANGPFTICFWKKNNLTGSTPAFSTMFEMFNSVFVRLQNVSNPSLERGYAYVSLPFNPASNPAFELTSDGGADAGSTNWVHYALVHKPGISSNPDKVNFKLFVNGVSRGELSTGSANDIYKITNGFTIGGGTNATNVTQANKRYDGTIDEFYVYNRVLTPAEIVLVKEEQNVQILPVTLQSFSGKITNQTTTLNWHSTNEVNTSHFEVEYSNNGRDFEKVTTVAASGNSTITQNYTAYHTVSSQAKHYYRLKMIDKDGKFTYSQVVVVNASNTQALSVVLQGTQVQNQLQFTVTSNKATSVNIAVTNSVGQMILQPNKKSISAGSNSFSYFINNFISGVYFLEMVDESGLKQVVKFLK